MSGTVEIMRRVARAELARRRGCRLAVVTATHPHAAADDENNYEVDVRLKHEGLELRRIPVCTAIPGFVASPRVDDLVLVDFLDGDLAQPLVIACLYHAADRPPLYADGELIVEHRVPGGTRNLLRFAADGTIQVSIGDKVRLTLAEDGVTIHDKVAIDGDVTIQGDVTIEGDLEVNGPAGSTKISGHDITGT